MSAEQLLKDIRARVVSLGSQPVIPGVNAITAVLHQIDSIEIGDYVVSDIREALDDFDARQKALTAARAHVAGLPEEQPNARGYRDSKLPAEKRIAEELRIARFLLGQED